MEERKGAHVTSMFEFPDGEKGWIELSIQPMPEGIFIVSADITERKNMEREALCAKMKLQNIFATSPDAIAVADLNGNVTDYNKRAMEMLGYSSKNQLKGKTIFDIFAKKEKQKAMEVMKNLLKQGTVKDKEIALVKKDGSELLSEISASVLRDASGNLSGIVGIARDITERKRAEATLRESECRLRTYLDSIHTGILLVDPATHVILDANATTISMFGASKDQIVGSICHKFICPAEKGRCPITDLGQNVDRSDRTLVKANGEVLPIIKTVVPALLSDRRVLIESFIDITERKKGEEALSVSQKKFESLFMRNPEAAVYLGPDFRIQDLNPRFEELFGYSLAEIKGKHINDVVVPDDRKKEGESLDKDAWKGYVYRNTVRRRKDGSLVPVSVSAAPITGKDGIAGVVAMYHDISDSKNAEKRLNAMNEKLHVVGGLTRHDVRNKLASVTGNVYLARKKLAQNDEAQGYMTEIESAVQQVASIFEFAGMYEKLGSEELTETDVGKSLEESVSQFQNMNGVKIINECHGLIVLADSLLRQLFYNLIDNSLKHGGKVSSIRVYYEKVGDGLNIVYEDDGVGIPMDIKPKLFKEGYTTSRGSGYGLYLIKRMMDVYGWIIDEAGLPGQGARFTINISRTKRG